ncbi:MAG TPA: cell division protein FtsL [Thiobacillaceae bacterium]|nr:cell division protein FtsL [Thiobacillaceae bacterium]HNU63707.1 cell division protein FtsL [Thiobacillaceae bacterium]
MVRLNLLLTLVLLVCALAVVSARHQARKLFVQLQTEQTRARDLDIEWGRLQLEISTWLMHNRVEEVARTRLNMAVPDPRRVYVLQEARP